MPKRKTEVQSSRRRSPARLLISGGEIFDDGKLRRGDVLIEDDEIIEIGELRTRDHGAVSTIDARGQVVMPGFCNAHTHTHNVFARGAIERGSLEVLISCMTPLVSGATPEETYAAALLNALEQAKSGITSSADLFVASPHPTTEHIGAVVRAYQDMGLRANIAPLVGDLPLYPSVPGLLSSLPQRLRREVEQRTPRPYPFNVLVDAVDRWHGASDGRISVSIAPSIPLLTSDGLMRQCIEFAHARKLILHTNLVESRVQAQASFARYGKSVAAHLADIGFLSDRTSVGHAVWVTPHDIELLAETGTMVEHLPASNFRIGSGIAPIAHMLARGVRVALGTDGMASSDNQNIFEAMRVAVFASNARTQNQDEWLRPADVLPMCLEHTNRVLGVPYRLGRVRRGYRADLVLLRKSATSFHPDNDFVNQLVLAENGSAVDAVIVDGRVVIKDGRLASLDEAAITSAIDTAAASVRARNSRHSSVSRRLVPFVARACSALNTDLVSLADPARRA